MGGGQRRVTPDVGNKPVFKRANDLPRQSVGPDRRDPTTEPPDKAWEPPGTALRGCEQLGYILTLNRLATLNRLVETEPAQCFPDLASQPWALHFGIHWRSRFTF